VTKFNLLNFLTSRLRNYVPITHIIDYMKTDNELLTFEQYLRYFTTKT